MILQVLELDGNHSISICYTSASIDWVIIDEEAAAPTQEEEEEEEEKGLTRKKLEAIGNQTILLRRPSAFPPDSIHLGGFHSLKKKWK